MNLTLSARTQPSQWARKGYNRYRQPRSFAGQCASLQRWIEVNAACYAAVAIALFGDDFSRASIGPQYPKGEGR